MKVFFLFKNHRLHSVNHSLTQMYQVPTKCHPATGAAHSSINPAEIALPSGSLHSFDHSELGLRRPSQVLRTGKVAQSNCIIQQSLSLLLALASPIGGIGDLEKGWRSCTHYVWAFGISGINLQGPRQTVFFLGQSDKAGTSPDPLCPS